MKRSSINTSLSNDACSNFLEKTNFHSSIGLSGNEGNSEMNAEADMGSGEEASGKYHADNVCHQSFGGLCQLADNCQLACRMVKIFNRCLGDHGVRVGNLLLFTSSKDSFLGFFLAYG